MGQRWGYLATLVCAHVVGVLIAFVLYRFLVFRVRGHMLADLGPKNYSFWRKPSTERLHR